MKKSELIPYPEAIQAELGMDGRHHAVPLMVKDKRWDDEENQPYHPRIGSITHGWGHTDQFNAEHLAMEIAVRYNSYPKLKALLAEIGNIANGIRAADGAPRGYSAEYFDELVNRIHTACDGDCLSYSWKDHPSRDSVTDE